MSTELSSPVHSTQTIQPAFGQTTPWVSESIPKWRANPERLAWCIISLSFVCFIVLLYLIPLSYNYITQYTTVTQEARLEPSQGTLLLYPPSTEEAIAISAPRTTPRNNIMEGSRIVTLDDGAQGTLSLMVADNSLPNADPILGSMQIYAGTELDVLHLRRPYFNRSNEPHQAKFYLNRGQTRIFTQSSTRRPLQIELESAHGTILLEPGSYRVSVTEAQTDIVVHTGRARLTGLEGDNIIVDPGIRAQMKADIFLQLPASDQQNLIANGDFNDPMLQTWDSYVVADGVIPGTVRIVEDGGRRVAYFIRQGEENVFTEVGITQKIEQDVNVYDNLQLQLDVRLMHQSLSGAGQSSSEFPLRVEMAYTDIYGKELRWGHGFYFRNPEDPNWKVYNGEKIAPFQWYTYESPNLIEQLEATRPARINSIRIYASGWNYQSMISEIYLTVR